MVSWSVFEETQDWWIQKDWELQKVLRYNIAEKNYLGFSLWHENLLVSLVYKSSLKRSLENEHWMSF